MPSLAQSGDTPEVGRRRSSRILLGALAALGIYLSWRILQPFTTVILWAWILAFLFKPLHRRLAVRTGSANLAATITLIVALVSVLLPIAAVSLAVAGEIGNLLDEAPARWSHMDRRPFASRAPDRTSGRPRCPLSFRGRVRRGGDQGEPHRARREAPRALGRTCRQPRSRPCALRHHRLQSLLPASGRRAIRDRTAPPPAAQRPAERALDGSHRRDRSCLRPGRRRSRLRPGGDRRPDLRDPWSSLAGAVGRRHVLSWPWSRWSEPPWSGCRPRSSSS